MAGNDQAGSIQACAMRVARLAADGSTPAGSNNMMVVNQLIKLDYKVVEEAGDEFTVKNACGGILFSYKDGDRIKRLDLTLTMASPDPELAEMFTAGSIITAAGQTIGYSAPAVGANPPLGVCLEVWSKAWIGASSPAGVVLADGATTSGSTTVTAASGAFTTADVGRTISGTGIAGGATITSVTNSTTIVISAAATATGASVVLTIGRPGPYFRWVFPRFVGSLGDGSLENAAKQNAYNGPAYENLAIGNGPNNDFPAGMVGSRMYSYFRDTTIPTPVAGYQATPTQV